MEPWKELTAGYDLSLSDHSLALSTFEKSLQSEANIRKAVHETAVDLIFLAAIENRPGLFGSSLQLRQIILGERMKRKRVLKPLICLLFAGFEIHWRISEEEYVKFGELTRSPNSSLLRRYRDVSYLHQKLQGDETIQDVANRRYADSFCVTEFPNSLTLPKKSYKHIGGEYRLSRAVPLCFKFQQTLTNEEFRRAVRVVEKESKTVDEFREKTARFPRVEPSENKERLQIPQIEKLMGERKLTQPEVEAIVDDLSHLILHSLLTETVWANFGPKSFKDIKHLSDKIERLLISWILKAPPSKGAKIRTNCILLAERALAIGNFQLAFCCISPLMSHDVSRLKLGLESDHPLIILFSLLHNFENYRHAEKKSGEPIVPWIDTTIRDLTHADEMGSESDIDTESPKEKIYQEMQVCIAALELCYPQYREVTSPSVHTNLCDLLKSDESQLIPPPRKIKDKESWGKLSFGTQAHQTSVIRKGRSSRGFTFGAGDSPRDRME